MTGTEKLLEEILEKLNKVDSKKVGEFKYSTSMRAERKISRVDYENDTLSVMVTMKYDDDVDDPDWGSIEKDLTGFIDKWEEGMRSRPTKRSTSEKNRGGWGNKKKYSGFKKDA